MVDMLLRNAQDLRVLASSRELLGLPTKPRIGQSSQRIRRKEGLSRLNMVCG